MSIDHSAPQRHVLLSRVDRLRCKHIVDDWLFLCRDDDTLLWNYSLCCRLCGEQLDRTPAFPPTAT